MRIAMIAGMVIGMVALNGCTTMDERDVTSKNIVRSLYPDGNVVTIKKFHYMVIVPGKVVVVECMAQGSDDVTDSTVYIVPSKCQ